jgi:RNA polymerase sigma-70 factor, ECF subfamily
VGKFLVMVQGHATTKDEAPVALSSVGALIGAVARGSQAALKRLYQLESRRLYGIALRIVQRPEIADDVLQETFVQVWRNAAGFDPARGTPEAWLTGIVRFRALDAVRKQRREELSDDPSLGDTPEFVDPAEAIDLKAAGPALARCLGQLDEAQRLCITLAYVEGLSQAEIAARIRSPLGTVKSWLRRGLLSLRSCLEP